MFEFYIPQKLRNAEKGPQFKVSFKRKTGEAWE